MGENSGNGPQATEATGKKWLRRKWIAVGACVCAVAVVLAFLAPSDGGPPENVASAETTQEAAMGSDATEEPAESASASPLPTRTRMATLKPTPEATPDPTQEPKAADFTHSAIVGSSTTQGLYMYGTLPEPDYYYHTSLTLEGLYGTVMDGYDKPIIEALGDKPYDQIFLAFGLNELGWDVDTFLAHYAQVIDTIRAEQPQAVIYLESLLPVGPVTSARNRFNVNQDRINEFNAALAQFAPEHGAYYLDVSTPLKDENGFLPDAISADGIHLNQEGCAMWADILRAGVTALLNTEGGPVVSDISAMLDAPDGAPTADSAKVQPVPERNPVQAAFEPSAGEGEAGDPAQPAG